MPVRDRRESAPLSDCDAADGAFEGRSVARIATGDIFRANVQRRTPLGLEAKRYLEGGDFVPDSVTNDMVRNRPGEDDVSGSFLLDGYPPTVIQVEGLDEILGEGEVNLDVVLQLAADDSEPFARLLGRAKETGRSDDTLAVIRHRPDLYYAQTEAVVARYADRGILVQIDGSAPIPVVTKRAVKAITSAAAVAEQP